MPRPTSCYVNGVGGQDELVFDGQSVVLRPEGAWWHAPASSRRNCWSVDIEAEARPRAVEG